VKIQDDNGTLQGIPAQARGIQAGQADLRKKNLSAAKDTGDRVELSDQARALYVANEALSALPEIRQDVVEPLKAAVKSGAYRVPGEKIAERMLAEDLFA
jgi:negative regulator of flagellin synthesis FlgM